MKKFLLSVAVLATTILSANAAVEHFLNVPLIYQDVIDGVITQVAGPTGTPPTKYEFTNNVTQGIFTVWSPDSRRMRIDVQSPAVPWSNGTESSTHRLEPNGSSNSSNGRKIYINCPTAGTLTVGAWATTAGRGYTLESAGVIGGGTTGTLDATYAANLPLLPSSPYAGEEMTPQTFEISEKMIVVLNPDAGIYYGFIKFVEKGGEGPGPGDDNHEWIVGNDLENFPLTSGFAAVTNVKGLVITPKNPMTGTIPTNMGEIEETETPKTFGDITYPNRFKFNGAGYSGASGLDEEPLVNMPTQRYLSFKVNGEVTIDIVGIVGGGSDPRNIFLTDGTNLIGKFTFSDEISKETVEYEGGEAMLYMFCNAACNIYHIKVSTEPNAVKTLSVSDKIAIGVQYYDLLGRKVSASTTGIIIEKSIYQDGTSSSKKVLK
ncbi:MAG: hypothetical protein LBI82_11975 [Dysgonamonadaceae bacterium]|jgi:hypothetical protein|nr:hypothetical protein [Dysgonamonadaceae bacterium]